MAERLAPMELRLMAAVSGELEGVNVTRLCRELGVTTKTFYKWRHRFETEGLDGLTPRSRRPRRSPTRTPVAVEDRIVELRKQLDDVGLDAGAATIRWHLQRGNVEPVPSEATVWRILCRRGFVSSEPKKRPRASWRRFEAAAPNELWQIDGTDWSLVNDTPVKIMNVLDDHSRYVPASHAAPGETSEAAWAAFSNGVREIGMPSGCLSDNGLAFSGRLRGFEVAFEINLREVGVRAITSRPYHPQTCGKVERFQQTLKKWLRSQPAVATIADLQAQLDWFRSYYNHQRPHRAIGRITPVERLNASPRLQPTTQLSDAVQRHINTTVTATGIIELHRWSIGIGVDHAGQPAEVYLTSTHANVFIKGALVRHLEIDPNRHYQPSGRKRGGPRRPRPT
jgi:transposase InsO family protein